MQMEKQLRLQSGLILHYHQTTLVMKYMKE